MPLSHTCSCFLLYVLSLLLISKNGHGAKFTIVNSCDFSIWPGLVTNAGDPLLDIIALELAKDSSLSFMAPTAWRGGIWGRTGCNFDGSGHGSCATGDCGSGESKCNGTYPTRPVTLAEFTFGSGPQDFYDVSLVNGYNLPMAVEGTDSSGACGTAGCVLDLNRQCPKELRVGDGVGCMDACRAFRTPEYCCTGSIPCKPSNYSQIFKAACPRAYSYPLDDATGTFACSGGADFNITFCPNFSSLNSSNSTAKAAGTPTENSSSESSMESGVEAEPTPDTPFATSGPPNSAAGDSTRIHPSLVVQLAIIVVLSLTAPT